MAMGHKFVCPQSYKLIPPRDTHPSNPTQSTFGICSLSPAHCFPPPASSTPPPPPPKSPDCTPLLLFLSLWCELLYHQFHFQMSASRFEILEIVSTQIICHNHHSIEEKLTEK